MITRLTADLVLRITIPDFGEFRIPAEAESVHVEFVPTPLRAELAAAGTGGGSDPAPLVYNVRREHLTQSFWKFTATIADKENETQ